MTPAQVDCVIEPIGVAVRLAGSGTAEGPMHWQRWLAALFIILALARCVQGTTGQSGAAYAPYSPENNGNMHDSGGGGAEVEAACSWRWRGPGLQSPKTPEHQAKARFEPLRAYRRWGRYRFRGRFG
jgi:hypothetical protein